jgi:hypothetical protein
MKNMETEILSLLKKQRAKFLNEFNKKNFGDALEKLENDPAIVNIEKCREEYTRLSATSNDPEVILMASFLDDFHKQFEINKQILRDCMNLDWEKETAEQEMKSMQVCLDESMKKLHSLLEQFKEVMV